MKHRFFLACAMFTMSIFSGCQDDLDINDSGNLVPKTVDENASLPSVSLNNALFHAEAFGPADGPLLVVLHGGPGSDYRYLLNCKEFANQGYRVVFYDQRGTGLSQRFPKSHYTMQVAYDDLSGIISHFRSDANQKVFLLGHSWGAMLASAYINQYPSAIDGAILAEPGGLVWKDVEDYITRSRKFKYFGESLNDAVYADQFVTGKTDQHAILDYKFMLLTSQESSEIGNEGSLQEWRGGAVTFDAYLEIGDKQKPDWTTNLNKYTTQVLFIYSANNKAYGLQHAQKVSAPYPSVKLFETEGAGHDMLSFPTGWNNTYPVMLDYLNSMK
ncbi:MAG: alpha/beta hydrolase [Imperialibacter sp.]|uniref:alpha/beta hydrolase n=1 Tax=Imperialibacter sp. TaxID=2038411 RepID=UPI003A8AE65E